MQLCREVALARVEPIIAGCRSSGVVQLPILPTGMKVMLSLSAVVAGSIALFGGAVWALSTTRQSSWFHSNDGSAYFTLLNICAIEREFRASRCIDADGDGIGEFGTLAELSGGAELLGKSHVLNPPLLSGAFRTIALDGFARRSGYRIRVYLPDAAGNGVHESGLLPSSSKLPSRDRATDLVDPKLASRRWCAYAWPEEHERSGRRTFVIDQDGTALCTIDPRYSGDHGPLPGAAFVAGGSSSIVGRLARGAAAQDGNLWADCR